MRKKIRKFSAIVLILSMLMTLSMSALAAENVSRSSDVVDEKASVQRATTLLDYVGIFDYFYSSTFTVPTNSTVVFVYNVQVKSGSSGNVSIIVENASTGRQYLNTNYTPGSGTKSQSAVLPAGTYNVICWGQSDTTYVCGLNFYIP